MGRYMDTLTHWTLLAITLFCLTVSGVAFVLTAAQLVAAALGLWP